MELESLHAAMYAVSNTRDELFEAMDYFLKHRAEIDLPKPYVAEKATAYHAAVQQIIHEVHALVLQAHIYFDANCDAQQDVLDKLHALASFNYNVQVQGTITFLFDNTGVAHAEYTLSKLPKLPEIPTKGNLYGIAS